jgi:[ribosomal protein S5]-alanine N-acetyltransferase
MHSASPSKGRPRVRERAAVAVGLRVMLRPPRATDGPELTRANRASARLHRGRMRPPRSAPEFARSLARARQPNAACLLVCRRGDGAIAGVINISEIVRGAFQSAYLGYCAVARFAGHGLMTEALQLALGHAFDRLGLHRVEANIQPGNTPSIRLVERAGFRREGYSPRYLKIAGRWRDQERWALLREAWRPARVGRGGDGAHGKEGRPGLGTHGRAGRGSDPRRRMARRRGTQAR